MGDGKSGYYAALLKKWLKDIMYGNVQHEWGVVIEEEQMKQFLERWGLYL